MYKSSSVKKDGLVVRRCIITRSRGVGGETLGALPVLSQLEEQEQLLIISQRIRAKHGGLLSENGEECPAVRSRLLKWGYPNEDNEVLFPDRSGSNSPIKVIDNILGIDGYHYFPVVHQDDCDPKVCGCNRTGKWGKLLNEFVGEQFHSSPADALYCTITEREWQNVDKNESLKRCFKAGWTPEIVLFGEEPEIGGSPTWYCGIIGHYLPFTPQISLTLYNSEQSRKLYEGFTTILCADSASEPKRLEALIAS